jgi:hypothetical protein
MVGREALQRENYPRVCKLLSYGAELQVFVDAGSSKPSCARDLRRVLRLDADEKWPLTSTLASRADFASASVSIRGERATVEIPGEPQLNFTRIDGRWLIDTQFQKWLAGDDYERCWRQAGAQIASDARDLRFAAGDKKEPASLQDLSRVSVDGKQWRMFYALPLDGVDPGIAAVIADPNIVPVVAYVRNAQRHKEIVVRARSCSPQT